MIIDYLITCTRYCPSCCFSFFQSVILRYPWSVSQLYSVSQFFKGYEKQRFFVVLYKSKLEKTRILNMFAVGLIRAGPFCIECTDVREIRECLRTTIKCGDNEVNRFRKYRLYMSNFIKLLTLKHALYILFFSCSLNVFNFLVSC